MTTLEIIDLAVLILFTVGLAITVVRLSVRLFRYAMHGQRWPLLAGRDIIAFGGLLLPFLLILVARATGESAGLASNVVWRIVTAGPALIAVWTLAYFELYVIERRRK